MQLLSRREYNLILRSLDKYELYMNSKEKELGKGRSIVGKIEEKKQTTKKKEEKKIFFFHHIFLIV